MISLNQIIFGIHIRSKKGIRHTLLEGDQVTKSGKSSVVSGLSWCATSVLGSHTFRQASMESWAGSVNNTVYSKLQNNHVQYYTAIHYITVQ